MSGVAAARDAAGRPRAPHLAAFCGVMLCAGAACAPDTVTVREYPHFAPHAITRVAIAPFRGVKDARAGAPSFGAPPPDQDDAGIRRSLRGAAPARRLAGASTVSVPPFAPEAIRHMVYARLKRNPRVRVVPPDAVEDILRDADAEGDAGARRAQRLGRRLEVDAVIEGVVRVYREREGASFAAIPAAVGFELRLRGAGDGGVLWVGEYFEEQKPLTQDARGFFERRGAFVTAEELARDGVMRVLRRLSLGEESPGDRHGSASP